VPDGLGLSSEGLVSGTPTGSGSFTFTVSVTNPLGDAGSRQYTFVVAASGAQPDVMIKNGTRWIGDDEYGAPGQNLFKNARRNQEITYTFRVENDGRRADTYTLAGTPPTAPKNYSIRYFVGSVNVTAAVVAGTYRTPELDPDEAFTITARVKPKAAIWIGAEFPTYLFARSSIEPVLVDRARGVTTVVR
jgi:hypothetical protein